MDAATYYIWVGGSCDYAHWGFTGQQYKGLKLICCKSVIVAQATKSLQIC